MSQWYSRVPENGSGDGERVCKELVLQRGRDIGRCGMSAGELWSGGGINCYDKERDSRNWDVGWCGVGVLITPELVECKITQSESDGRLEHEKWFEGGSGTYIKRSCFVLEDFLFISLYWFSWIAKQVMTLKQLQFVSCPESLDTNFKQLLSWSDQTL
jgi:hypothetical protein